MEEKVEDKIKNLKLTATRLALFERRLGRSLTKLTDADLGMNAFVVLLEVAGMDDKEIDEACDKLGLEKFADACMEALFNSGLFSKAKLAKEKAMAEKNA